MEDKITWICLLIMCIGTVMAVVGGKIGSVYFVLYGTAAAILFSVVCLFHLHKCIMKNELEGKKERK